MISMARTFGAPDKVPAGNAARSASVARMPSASSPTTLLSMCMTWLYRWMPMSSRTLTVPGRATRPTSLRPRSTSITCSARSLGSSSSSSARRWSSARVWPRGRVPAIGRSLHPALVTFTSISGDAPTRATSPKSRKNMYGDGLTVRNPR